MSFLRTLQSSGTCRGCSSSAEGGRSSSQPDLANAFREAAKRLKQLEVLSSSATCWEDLAACQTEKNMCEEWLNLLEAACDAIEPKRSKYAEQIPLEQPGMAAFEAWMSISKPIFDKVPQTDHCSDISLCVLETSNRRVRHTLSVLSSHDLQRHFHLLANRNGHCSTIFWVTDLTPTNVSFLGTWLRLTHSLFVQHLWRSLPKTNSSRYLGYALDLIAEPAVIDTKGYHLKLFEGTQTFGGCGDSPPTVSHIVAGLHRLEWDVAITNIDWDRQRPEEEHVVKFRSTLPLMSSELAYHEYPFEGERGSLYLLTQWSFIPLHGLDNGTSSCALVLDPYIPKEANLKAQTHIHTGDTRTVFDFLDSQNAGSLQLMQAPGIAARTLAVLATALAIDPLRHAVAVENHNLACVPSATEYGPRRNPLTFYEVMLSRVLTLREVLLGHQNSLKSEIADVLALLPEQQRSCLQRLVAEHESAATKLLCILKASEDSINHMKASYMSTLQISLTHVQIEESRSAIRQASTVHRLTILAFIYIPTSCVCGFFGMNIIETPNGFRISTFGTTLGIVLLATLALAFAESIAVLLTKIFYHYPKKWASFVRSFRECGLETHRWEWALILLTDVIPWTVEEALRKRWRRHVTAFIERSRPNQPRFDPWRPESRV